MHSQPPFRDASRTGLFLDFDGTVSEIVDVPDEARPLDGVPTVLAELGRHFRVVAIVSGRRADQLLSWLGPDVAGNVEIWGTHGAERVSGGEIVTADEVTTYVEVMDRLERSLAAEPALEIPGTLLERKAVILALHYRMAPDPVIAEEELLALAERYAAEHDLEIARGRMVVELRPKVDLSKRSVVLARARRAEVKVACFIGDDLVDLGAFDALDDLEKEGIEAVRIAVRSAEAPASLIARADAVLEGPRGVLAFLRI